GFRRVASPMIDGFQRAGLCRGNFFIFKILEGSSHCLERFWARYPISRAEWAGQPFSVVAAWRPFKRAKPAAWDPPPRFPIWACFERFSPEDILRFLDFGNSIGISFFSIVVIMGSLSRWMMACY